MIGFVFRGTPALLRQVHADANIINRNGRLPPQIHIAFTEGRLQLTPVSASAGKWCQQEAIEVAAFGGLVEITRLSVWGAPPHPWGSQENNHWTHRSAVESPR